MEAVMFVLLGPVEVRLPGRSSVALPPAVRALLARLALNPGRVVSVDALTDALWGEDLPADAADALQVRVSKLRRRPCTRCASGCTGCSWLALHWGGRQADALTLYHRLRTRLADELGIDPSPELRALAEAILRQQLPEPAPPPRSAPHRVGHAADAADAPAPAPARAVPRTTAAPPALSSVIGRRGDVDAILGLLADTRLVTLTGPGGVDKTTLGLEVIRHLDAAQCRVVRRTAARSSRRGVACGCETGPLVDRD